MRYYIRQQKKYVSGPHDLADIRAWIKQGKVRDEMEFSRDGSEWLWGIEIPEMFPQRRRRIQRRRRA